MPGVNRDDDLRALRSRVRSTTRNIIALMSVRLCFRHRIQLGYELRMCRCRNEARGGRMKSDGRSRGLIRKRLHKKAEITEIICLQCGPLYHSIAGYPRISSSGFELRRDLELLSDIHECSVRIMSLNARLIDNVADKSANVRFLIRHSDSMKRLINGRIRI